MTVDLPEIRIKDAWLLRENVSQHLHELWGKGTPLADDDWMEQRVTSYQKSWQRVEQKILTGLAELTGLTYKQNIIDVYIAPWFSAFSDPMVIGVMREPDQFIDTLTHELIHRLLTDNTSLPFDTNYLTRWKKLFGKNHSFGTLVHIPVHAVHKAVYIDILNEPDRLERDLQENKSAKAKAEDYVAAWEYVEEHDYKAIIDKLKRDYAHGN